MNICPALNRATLAFALASWLVSPVVRCECGWVHVEKGKRVWTDEAPPFDFDEYRNYPVIFQGSVTKVEIEKVPSSSCEGCYTERDLVSFKIDKVWKGEVSNEYRIRTEHASTACGYRFSSGAQYLVYLRGPKTEGYYEIDSCSRTKRVSDANEELRQLASFQGRQAR
jgi:hypothetical protein